MSDRLRQKLGELLVVENLEGAAGRDFADCCRMKSVVVVAVAGLDENGRIREAFGVHLSANVIQMDTCFFFININMIISIPFK